MAAKTLYSLLQHQVEQRPMAVAALLQERGRWRNLTWEELGREVHEIALGLLTLDVNKGDRVAIIARSRVEWVAVDLATSACGAISAAILHRLPAEQCADLVERTGCAVVFVDSAEYARRLLEARRLPTLRHVVVFEQDPQVGASSAEVLDLLELRRRGLVAQGARAPLLQRRLESLEPADTSTMLFTSGTREEMKIVAISHDALVYEVEALARLEFIDSGDVMLLCMPMAHAFARVFCGLWLRSGGTISLADSTRELFEYIEVVQPTLMAAPPRVFELLYGTIVRSGHDVRGPRSRLFAWAMKQAREHMLRQREGAEPQDLRWKLAQHAVFERIEERLRTLFGGRARRFICGGGPLADRVNYFFSFAGIDIDLSYGLTEATGISCLNTAGRGKIGSVGPTLPGTEIRIGDEGEILLRGRGLMKGYWAQPEDALEFTEDGFLRTGDLGELDVDGFLRVQGRVEDVISFADGRILDPMRIEMALRTNAFVGHALIDGNGSGELVALVSLDPEAIQTWARGLHLPYRTLADLSRAPEVRRLIQGVIDDRNRRYKAGQGVRRFAIVENPFAIGDELTATMRLRRHHVRAKYRVTLDALHGADDVGEM
ncbi:MAG: AMP-binding protein [Pseudomonadota bacterium]